MITTVDGPLATHHQGRVSFGHKASINALKLRLLAERAKDAITLERASAPGAHGAPDLQ